MTTSVDTLAFILGRLRAQGYDVAAPVASEHGWTIEAVDRDGERHRVATDGTLEDAVIELGKSMLGTPGTV